MPLGKLGGLICWENYMPPARNAMYAWGTQIYVAPTWDSSGDWLLSLRHFAREGGIFVIECCTAMHMRDLPDRYTFKALYPKGKEWINRGNSCIINPRGNISTAEIDLRLVPASKRMFDVAGHYARPDVLGSP